MAATAIIDNRSSRGDVTAFKSEITDANYGRACDGENCELVDLRDAAQQQRFLLSDSCDSSRCDDGHLEYLANCTDDDIPCRNFHGPNCIAAGAAEHEPAACTAGYKPFRPNTKWDMYYTCCKEDSFIGNFIPIDLTGPREVETRPCTSDADCLSCDEDDAEDVASAKCNLIGVFYPEGGLCTRTSTARDASVCTGTGHPERSDVNEYTSRLTMLANADMCLDQKWHSWACARPASQTSRRLRSEEVA